MAMRQRSRACPWKNQGDLHSMTQRGLHCPHSTPLLSLRNLAIIVACFFPILLAQIYLFPNLSPPVPHPRSPSEAVLEEQIFVSPFQQETAGDKRREAAKTSALQSRDLTAQNLKEVPEVKESERGLNFGDIEVGERGGAHSLPSNQLSGSGASENMGDEEDGGEGRMRLLFMTLEYKAGTFSGNGVYSQSMVRSLSKLGHEVFVVSGKPPASWGKGSGSSNSSAQPEGRVGAAKDVEWGLAEIEVPVWGRLDWECGWEAFAKGMTADVCADIARFRPQWALVVDWSAIRAFSQLALSDSWKSEEASVPPMAYLNYRIYTLSEYRGEDGQRERQFYRVMESEAVGMASAVAALSTRDARFLAAELGAKRRVGVECRPLLPPLREDIRAIASRRELQDLGSGQEGPQHLGRRASRRFLSCCVRLSPEKNAELFADIVEHLAAFLAEEGIVPLLCGGAASGGEYGARMRARVVAAAPNAVVHDGFLPPEGMADVYLETLLNVHPCVYDAYGMTLVEAAAFGAPSVVHVGEGGAVGATELLSPEQGMAVPIDLTLPPGQVAAQVRTALLDRRKLAEVGEAARRKSLSWSEAENARELLRIVRAAPHLSPTDSSSA